MIVLHQGSFCAAPTCAAAQGFAKWSSPRIATLAAIYAVAIDALATDAVAIDTVAIDALATDALATDTLAIDRHNGIGGLS